MKREELLKVAKPILFNTRMVRAIMKGRKSVTRRLIKPQPKFYLCYIMAGSDNKKWHYPDSMAHHYWGEKYILPDCINEEDKKMLWNPPFYAGDILYVRETWCVRYDGEKYFYFADKCTCREEKKLLEYDTVKWKPSIHMPKEAARIFLKVNGVNVERLQDVTEELVVCEGTTETFPPLAIDEFRDLWDSTIKKADIDQYGWKANPYVWVIDFERVEVEE